MFTNCFNNIQGIRRESLMYHFPVKYVENIYPVKSNADNGTLLKLQYPGESIFILIFISGFTSRRR
jgi:hypothetical protein